MDNTPKRYEASYDFGLYLEFENTMLSTPNKNPPVVHKTDICQTL